MKTRLDRLIESIDPAITLDLVEGRANDAINTFQVETGVIQRWGEFKDVLTRFHWHVQKRILKNRLEKTPDPEIEWGRCCQTLLKEFGPNGEKAAFELTRTGTEGGLYTVLKAVARNMVGEFAGNEIAAKISFFWRTLSVDEQFAATEEYLKKYGHLLPSELTEGNAVRIKADFTKVLREHPRIVRRLRQVGKRQ
ncbi:MAG: hypothetical protein C4582_00645 [Desulfobacteraceae bacterium]|jgi:hypothetical protein|nr:MAG: hypothetical protein C4582_00645 [Desulfobacteraceae bacterium]